MCFYSNYIFTNMIYLNETLFWSMQLVMLTVCCFIDVAKQLFLVFTKTFIFLICLEDIFDRLLCWWFVGYLGFLLLYTSHIRFTFSHFYCLQIVLHNARSVYSEITETTTLQLPTGAILKCYCVTYLISIQCLPAWAPVMCHQAVRFVSH